MNANAGSVIEQLEMGYIWPSRSHLQKTAGICCWPITLYAAAFFFLRWLRISFETILKAHSEEGSLFQIGICTSTWPCATSPHPFLSLFSFKFSQEHPPLHLLLLSHRPCESSLRIPLLDPSLLHPEHYGILNKLPALPSFPVLSLAMIFRPFTPTLASSIIWRCPVPSRECRSRSKVNKSHEHQTYLGRNSYDLHTEHPVTLVLLPS